VAQPRAKMTTGLFGKRGSSRRAPSGSPVQMVLHIGDSQSKTVSLPMAERILVGRNSEDAAGGPQLDLTRFNAAGHGVSRLHAALRYDRGQLTVEDLGSTNGTRLNGLSLQSHVPYTLRNGDEMELGSLRVTVRLIVGKA
jgi:pSer/pThr/pTyr-binding forkhead associated (FHA) protein